MTVKRATKEIGNHIIENQKCMLIFLAHQVREALKLDSQVEIDQLLRLCHLTKLQWVYMLV
jgi:hypothetical protein